MVHLHVHTKYSLLDSIIDIDDLIKKLQQYGHTACAITDHGNMYGTCEAFKKMKKAGIKCIIGCECYICDDRFVKDKDSKTYHLVLLAKDEDGRQNLHKLVSKSTKTKYRGKPRIDFALLKEHHNGIICLSACMAGEVARNLTAGNNEKAEAVALKYKDLFGEDYYIEYQAHSAPSQQELNAQIVRLAQKLGIQYVVTCDAHYLNEDDQKYHGIFVQIGQTREVGESYNDCFIQDEQTILDKCQTTVEYNAVAVANTDAIAAKCSAVYPLSAPIIPHQTVPNGFDSEASYLKYLCNKGFVQKGISHLPVSVQKEYKKRARYEIESVTKMGFEGYYLLVHSYVSAAKRRGIARGSAGGSLLAYLIGIVDIDPIKFGLYFERFIDVGALQLLEDGKITKDELKIPDVDTDFSPSDRDKVMRYIVDTYGENNVVSLGTFQYIWAKGAIKDIGKVLEIPFSITNEITKNLDNESIDEAIQLGLLDKYKEDLPELFEYASRLSGLPKSFSMHSCGKVICMRNADYYNALEFSEDTDTWVLQGDMHTADDLGLVKIDLLGLRTLDVIYDTLEMIGKTYDYIAPHKINMNDVGVWSEFAKGETNTIFQFESTGMKRTLAKMRCDNIEDLGAVNALFRPGAMQYIDNYIARKHGTEEIVYLHPALEPILSNTYGIIVFQEQLIEIGRLAGLPNPDELRKATAKKKPELMAKIEPEMKNGLIGRGWTQEQVDRLWNDILEFARYSFNKAHAAAYALTAYISMYLKVHHPLEYMTACINSYEGKFDKIVSTVEECRRMNLTLKFDHWRSIQGRTTCRDGVIYLGIDTIKGCGVSVAKALNEIGAKEHESFLSILISADQNPNIDKKQMMVLIKLGFFDEYGKSGKLARIYGLFHDVYSAKVFSKDKLPVPEEIIKQCARETEKQYRDIENEKLFHLLCDELEDCPLSSAEIVGHQMKYLGYVTHVDASAVKQYLVLDLNTKYSPRLTLYCIENGTTHTMKLRTQDYEDEPFEIGDILRISSTAKKNKRQMINGEWCKILDEFDTWINGYEILKY